MVNSDRLYDIGSL